ncbi:MAG: hypothetical protein LRZ97_01350 [Candidatus Pacebacteria bacterium]|nr:hypothetical protein [Candidatus Paceibacterota bacterium]
MEINQNAQQDTNNNAEMPVATEEKQGGFGPLVGILIVVALIIFGGLYFWGSQLMSTGGYNNNAPAESFEVFSTTVEDGGTITDEEFDALFNDSTPASEDEAVLDATLDDLGDLDALDAELDALGTEL